MIKAKRYSMVWRMIYLINPAINTKYCTKKETDSNKDLNEVNLNL